MSKRWSLDSGAFSQIKKILKNKDKKNITAEPFSG